MNLMLRHAAERSGSALVGARYSATEITQGVVLAYGTAVLVEPLSPS